MKLVTKVLYRLVVMPILWVLKKLGWYTGAQ